MSTPKRFHEFSSGLILREENAKSGVKLKGMFDFNQKNKEKKLVILQKILLIKDIILQIMKPFGSKHVLYGIDYHQKFL